MRNIEFELLNLQNKAIIIFDIGEELFVRNENGFTIKLYQIFNFFCEVWYNSEANKIYKIQTIDIAKVALLYANNIDLNNLQN